MDMTTRVAASYHLFPPSRGYIMNGDTLEFISSLANRYVARPGEEESITRLSSLDGGERSVIFHDFLEYWTISLVNSGVTDGSDLVGETCYQKMVGHLFFLMMETQKTTNFQGRVMRLINSEIEKMTKKVEHSSYIIM